MEVQYENALLALRLYGPDGRAHSHKARIGPELLGSTSGGTAIESAQVRVTCTTDGSGRLDLRIYPVQAVRLIAVSLSCSIQVDSDAFVFFNGYQSWTEGRQQAVSGRTGTMGILGKLAEQRYRFSAYGDYKFGPQSTGPGDFCGWSYASFQEGKHWTVLGSTNDHKGAFTSIRARFGAHARRVANRPGQTLHGRLILSRDVSGKQLDPATDAGGYSLLAIGKFSGTQDEAFDAWFASQGVHAHSTRQARGWTSWYKHYENVNQAVVQKAIADYKGLVAQEPDKTVIIQIDDGWQTATGDWMHTRTDRFPDGLSTLAAEIRDTGCVPGLWLAPFAAAHNSQLAQQHPDWIARWPNGRPIHGGSNWNGFWALDPLSIAVRDYLAAVFDMVVGAWGFGFVKLDFLYAACIAPAGGMSRGELMANVMDYLRKLCGPALMHVCGVPLASAFGRADYCRIGCDVGLSWDGPPVEHYIHRERVSTKASIANTLARTQLNGRAFLNDPDVWIGRSGPDISLSHEQKALLRSVNFANGGLVFCSDDVEEIPQQWRSMREDL